VVASYRLTASLLLANHVPQSAAAGGWVHESEICTAKTGWFSHCEKPALDECQYCGKPFCEEHRYLIEGLDAVCNNKRCVAKHEDLARHAEYRARVRQRNGAGLCGVEDCGPHPVFECSLCEGLFCDKHVAERRYPYREGRVMVERPASVCDWCWQRRKLWRH